LETVDAAMPTLEKFIIFDYSGTLSLEAPRFARRENLVRALAETGLAALGIATPEVFWDRIVNPTWLEGSTTQIGYKKVMAGRILALGLAPGIPEGEIEAAASRFAERYVAESRIDPHWRPILSHIGAHPDTAVVVATDHYAEATKALIDFFQEWDIPAARISEGGNRERALSGQKKTGTPSPVFIANSADLGLWKADRRFWKIVKSHLTPEGIRRLLLVDDFGFNEESGDSYGERAKVAARQEKTVSVLREVFHAEAEVISFFLTGADRGHLIAEASARIDSFLK
jgi:hypothetical protein